MTQHQQGWIVFLAAIGMMAGLMSAEVRELTTWAEAFTPAFVGGLLTHFAAVIGAFVAGRLIPTATKGSAS